MGHTIIRTTFNPMLYLIPMISLRLNQYFSDFCNLEKQTKKKKQKQISKIEKTNILIENPKTQKKNKKRINSKPIQQKNTIKSNHSYPNSKTAL